MCKPLKFRLEPEFAGSKSVLDWLIKTFNIKETATTACATYAPNGQDGCYCARSGCGFHPYVVPNQADGTFLCRDHRGHGAFDLQKEE